MPTASGGGGHQRVGNKLPFFGKSFPLETRPDLLHGRGGSAEVFSSRPGTGVLFPHYVLEGRHRNPAVPIKAMRCNARMALIVLETERVRFNLRNWTATMPLNEEGFISRVSIRHSVSQDAVRQSYEHFVLAAAPWRNSATQTSVACPSGRRV
jgi:hypothetical protein